MPIEDIRAALHAALAHLAGSDADYAQTRNAVGFSKIDAPLGHSLAGTDPAIWSPAQTHAAWRIARRYRSTQLTMFDVDAIPEPEQPEIAAARTRNVPGSSVRSYPPTRVFMIGDQVAISWPYGEPDFYDKMDRVKAVPGRKWNPDDKVWTLPANEAALTALADMAADYADAPSRFVIDDDAVEALDRIGETLTATIQMSHAAVTTYEPRGLMPGETMRPFQRAGVEFLIKNKHVILADGMGSGKSIQAIMAAVDQAAWPILVSCPSSLKFNWRKEFRKWVDPAIDLGDGARPLRFQIADGMSGARVDSSADVVIINFDILGDYDWKTKTWKRGRSGHGWGEALSSIRWGCVIIDEATYIKSSKAGRTRAMRQIVKQSNPDLLFLLTGTPFMSRPIEGWTLIDMIGHGTKTFGGWKSYVSRYCGGETNYFSGQLDVTGASNTDELNQILRSSGAMIRRRKEDVLGELPPRFWSTVSVAMSAAGAKQYAIAESSAADFIAERRSMDKEREQTWKNDAITLGLTGEFAEMYVHKCRKEFRDRESFRLEENEKLLRFEALKQVAYAAKKDAAISWIDTFLESGEKLVVFAHHREVVQEIAERYSAPTIMGGQSPESIEKGKERFQDDPECKVIVCNILAGRMGHTLTAASNVAFLELAWTPGDMDQCLDRCHRIGQENAVTGWILAATFPDSYRQTLRVTSNDPVMDREIVYQSEAFTIDDEIAALLERKRAVVDSATDGAGELAQVSILKELGERITGRNR